MTEHITKTFTSAWFDEINSCNSIKWSNNSVLSLFGPGVSFIFT